MNLRKILAVGALMILSSGLALAAELAGKWTSEFDTQIGIQKYSYVFKTDGDKLSGKATFEHSMGSGEVELQEIKLSGDDISFVEPLKMQDQEIRITYTGKISGDEMKLTRQVGEFATEELVAKRAK